MSACVYPCCDITCFVTILQCEHILICLLASCTLAVQQTSLCAMQMVPVNSGCWTNALLTGIAFAGEGPDNLAIAAYDCDKVKLFDIGQ